MTVTFLIRLKSKNNLQIDIQMIDIKCIPFDYKQNTFRMDRDKMWRHKPILHQLLA